MKTPPSPLIDKLLLDVRFTSNGSGYLNEFASWVVKFESLDLKTHKQDLVHLAQLSSEFSRNRQTAELAMGLAQIVRSALDRALPGSKSQDLHPE